MKVKTSVSITNRQDITRERTGFTLVELLVVIAIIAILVLLLLPAVNAARESARRTMCISQVSQIALAVQSYHNTHEVYPTGVVEPDGPIVNAPFGNHQGWLISILPHLEETNTYRRIDQSVGVYHRRNAIAASSPPGILHCPSSTFIGNGDTGESSYAGVHHEVEAPIDIDNNGIFFLNSRISQRQVPDGTSHTLFVGEVADYPKSLSWLSGTRATLRNTGTALNMTGPNASGGTTVTDTMVSEFETERNEGTDYGEWDGIYADDVESEISIEMADEIDGAAGEDLVELEGDEVDADLASPRSDVETDIETSIDPHAAAKKDQTYVGGFGSDHSARGAIFAFGDGHVKFLPNSIDPTVYQQLGNRRDGSVIDENAIP